jgi:hypothetical protein
VVSSYPPRCYSSRTQILCHCLDCRKITGSAYSTNAIYPEDGFKVTKGTPKQHTVKGDSGNEITSHFWYVDMLSYSHVLF